VAFGAALVLYAKSLKIIAFAEHVPMLRAKINEPDSKYDMEAGFFDDVLAGYSRICNYQSILQADAFWRALRREAQAFAGEAGGDWVCLEVLGLHSHPQVARHWREIPENVGPLGLVIEALFPCVQLNPLEQCLRVDHLVVLRSTLPASDIASAIGEAMGHLGKPYDFEFDFNNSSRIVCTELIYRSYHNRGTWQESLQISPLFHRHRHRTQDFYFTAL
jgi:hypothetical protein